MTTIHIHEDTVCCEIQAKNIKTGIHDYLKSTIWSFIDTKPLVIE